MKQLTIEHLSAYLPYGVRVSIGDRTPLRLNVNNYNSLIDNEGRKPILRPLSDIGKEVVHNRETFIPMERIRKQLVSDSYEHDDFEHDIYFLSMRGGYLGQYRYDLMKMLHELHFDTFGLIESGLAIDINTLSK